MRSTGYAVQDTGIRDTGYGIRDTSCGGGRLLCLCVVTSTLVFLECVECGPKRRGWSVFHCELLNGDAHTSIHASAVGHSRTSVARALPRAILHHRRALVTRDMLHAPVAA